MIKKSDIQNIYSLSPMQEGMLYHYVKDGESGLYFEQLILTVRGEIDLEIFEKSFNKVIEKYDVLRTIFTFKKVTRPLQGVLKKREAEVYFRDISQMEDKVDFVHQFVEEEREKGFNLTRDLLVRVSILKLDSDYYKITWSFHHIILDGWCLGIIISDLVNFYTSIKQGEPLVVYLVQPYSDYIAWLSQQDKGKLLDYWATYLADYENSAIIPGSKIVSKKQYLQKRHEFTIPAETTAKIINIAHTNKITTSAVIHTIWGVLLQKYNNTEDIVFGSVVSGRSAEVLGIETMVGLFINTIPVRVQNAGHLSFTEMAKETFDKMIVSEKYGYVSLAEVQSKSILNQSLINHIVVFENYPMEDFLGQLDKKEEVGFIIEDFETIEQTNYDLVVIVVPGDKLEIELKYNSMIYDEEIIKRIEKHLLNIVEQITQKPDMIIEGINILDKTEENDLLYNFNDTKELYPDHKTIQQLFEEQVEDSPHLIALVEDNVEITYDELNKKANQLARVLRTKGVIKDDIVGIMMERSVELIIGIMGVLKAGRAYLPIDLDYPADRVNFLLEDSNAKVLLSKSAITSEIGYIGTVIDLTDAALYQGEDKNLSIVNTPNDLAYVIYTSGTTGRPKGVMIEHRSAVNYINWAAKMYLKGEKLDFPLYTSISFDLTITSIFIPLVTGNAVIIYTGKRSEILLEKIVNEDKVGIIKLTPTHCKLIRHIKKEPNNIKRLILGGENLETELAKDIFKNFGKKVEIYNEYGPTEATVGCMTYLYDYERDRGKSVSIGKPIDNVQIYILNHKLAPVGYEVIGEMYISGVGIARGYINKPELVADRFLDNPFISGQKMYKTGDMAKWLHNGTIEYIGRVDQQVKIRGYRIELEEISTRLHEHKEIKEAVVIAKYFSPDEQKLVAYVVANNDMNPKNLREYLSKELPEYMIPSYFIQLEKIPVTSNGKLEKDALPDVKNYSNNTDFVSPRNEIEDTLVTVWQEILGICKISIDDNFFLLGGTSINVIQMPARLQKYNLKFENIQVIFQYNTIRELSQHIRTAQTQDSKTNVGDWFLEERYYEQYGSDSYLHFNPGKDKKIFGFPGGLGFGFIFMGLANLLPNYSFYSFNFIKEEDRVKQYVNLINQAQPEGKLILVGYCSGGNIAFEVIHELEKHGRQVSDVILLDAFNLQEKTIITEAEFKELEDIFIEIVEKAPINVSHENMNKIVNDAIQHSVFHFSLGDMGRINANVHSIISENREEKQSEKEVFADLFSTITTKEFYSYQGYGVHDRMLFPGEVQKNADLVRKILEKIM
ncbi:MAG: amino acid adenylation domain-containing protein [Halanaerobiales bacterium]|nr:amino acid adenylation domain-containing protein [Halanaerobiales bacterium]